MAVKRPKGDPAHEETERLIADMEKRISKEYAQAEKEVQVKIDDYFDRFRLKDKKWQEWVADGKKTAAEYKQWRVGQMAVGKRWESMKQTIAEDFAHTDQIARSIVKGYMPEVYATNFNYGTYEVEVGAKVDTSFTLYDRQTVERIMRDNPDLLPAPGEKVSKDIAEGKAVRWNKQLIQSVMTQGILQGESIPKLATRLAKEVGDSDRKAAIRNARTMATGAQNAGRVDSYKRAEDMGIDMVQEWRATLDMRTRHSHRMLDGERQPVGHKFSNGCEYPGDPSAADPAEIYNCRCTLRGIVAGLEPQARKYRDDSMIEGMSYDEWKASKVEKPEPILSQKEKGEAIAESYRREYRDGVFGGNVGNQKVEVQHEETEQHKELIRRLKNDEIEYKEVKELSHKLTEDEIIERISGGDMTAGSCASLSYAYIANKDDLDVLDFRGGDSLHFFAQKMNRDLINKLDGVQSQSFYFSKEASDLAKKLKELDLPIGEEYLLSCGKHVSIIKNTEEGYKYLELQNATQSGWRSFTKKLEYVVNESGTGFDLQEKDCTMVETLAKRFGCKKSKSNGPTITPEGTTLRDENGKAIYAERVDLTLVDSFKGNDEFRDLMGYINTDVDKQKKGAKGGEK